MAALNSLEKSLDDVFVKNAPKLPEGGKKVLVEWLPWLNLVGGLLTLWAAYALWNWAHVANGLINYANDLSRAYGGGDVVADRLTAGIWLGIAVLVVEGVLYLLAFPATRDRKKQGWNYMFYALLVNIVYGLVVLFTDYGGFGSFLGTLVGSVIGLWLLFQIRGSYTSAKS
jgi:hypothetical protein